MAQGTNGSWYAYIADKTMVDNADGTGLNLTLLTHKQLHLLQSAIHHYQVHKESIP
jgi:hypothetical protein